MGYSLKGMGMARPTVQHLTATRNIVINWYLQTRFLQYEAYQEPSVELDTPESGYVPDVAFYEVNFSTASVVVEIDKGDGIDIARAKVGVYLNKYEVDEVFIYNYVTGGWERHTLNGKIQTSESEVLGVYLEDLIDLPPAPSLSGTPTHPQKPIVLL